MRWFNSTIPQHFKKGFRFFDLYRNEYEVSNHKEVHLALLHSAGNRGGLGLVTEGEPKRALNAMSRIAQPFNKEVFMTPILWDHDNYDLAVGPRYRVWRTCYGPTRDRIVPETVPAAPREKRVRQRIIVIRGLSSWAELRKAA